MSSITGISGNIANSYESLSSGMKVNSAADDAAGVSVIEKENAQATGLQVGKENMAQAKDALNVAEGALGSINDYLQRIRELAVGASNTATVSNSDREAMQAEVDQLLQGIADVAKNTNFNTKPLLDGSSEGFKLATDGDGGETTVKTADATLSALGIKDFDLTKSFDIGTIDDALKKVNDARSSMGAKSNALDYAMRYNASAAEYVTASKSRIQDTDFAEEISEKKKDEALLKYGLLMQKKKAEEEENRTKMMFDNLS